jgi:NADH-quinone oxidoreductase subunit N
MNAIVISGILGVMLMLAGLVLRRVTHVRILAILAAVLVVVATIIDYVQQGSADTFYFQRMLCTSPFTAKLNLILSFGLLTYFVLFDGRIAKVGLHKAEYFALILFATCGVFILSSFQSLFMLFLGIEIMSIPQYILAGTDKRNLKSNEASLKYFLMGSFSTGFLLMGIAMTYGAGRSFDVTAIADVIAAQPSAMGMMGIAFLLVAFGFKVGAAPFHTWTPDVYDGTPTSFTPIMASIVKVGVLTAFVKLFHTAFGTSIDVWDTILLGIILLTMLVGNITAVYQQSVKRMLAYSSIAQAGFMLIAVFAIGDYSSKGFLLYAASYILATMGIFAVLAYLKDYTYEGFNGLAKESPAMAFSATVCILSLAGIPLTGGFFAKYYMLNAAMKNGMPIWALIFAVLMAAVSVVYYFRVIRGMYFNPTEGGAMLKSKPDAMHVWVMVINAIALIVLGLLPALATKL